MMGIGVDIVGIWRIAEAVERSGDVFLRRVYSPAEVERARRSENPTAFLATAFAAKEAAFKALGMGDDREIDITEMEVSRGPMGEPVMELKGELGRFAVERGVGKVLLSVSYEAEYAVAFAVVGGE